MIDNFAAAGAVVVGGCRRVVGVLILFNFQNCC